GPRHARREVGVDQVGPLVDRAELVGGGEVDSRLPLLLADALADRLALDGFQICAHATILLSSPSTSSRASSSNSGRFFFSACESDSIWRHRRARGMPW